MLHSVILPKKYIYYDLDWYLREIDKYEPFFYFDKNKINDILDNIKEKHNSDDYLNICKNLLFFILNFVKSEDIENPIDYELYGSRPKDGFEFYNKKLNEGKGVYHAHISNIDKGVFIWYVTWDIRPCVNFVYEAPHPNDDYDNIINIIYNDKNAWHYNKSKFLYKMQYLNENVQTFNEYFESKK